MTGACEQCATLERQLSNIKDDIAAEIRKHHKPRSGAMSDKATRSSPGEFLASLEKAQALYDRHCREVHEMSL
jgi:hypothetical protein